MSGARLFMSVRLDTLPRSTPSDAVEPLTDRLLPETAALMASAYAGTVDDEGGTVDDALEELRKAFDGGYGEPVPDACLVVRAEQRLVSAIVTTRWEGRPLVAFVFTEHGFTGRGLARGVILTAADRLRDAGEQQLTLWVTATNRAARLYRSLGFGVERESAG